MATIIEIASEPRFGAYSQPAYLAKNPNGTIPVLEDGDVTLYEAAAINIYLADKFKSDLLPEGEGRYQTLKWMFWAAEHFRQGPPILFIERIAKRFIGAPEDPRAVADAEASLRKFAAVLDAHLAGRRFVVGDGFTLADIDLAAPLSQMSRSPTSSPGTTGWSRKRRPGAVPANCSNSGCPNCSRRSA
jgi:glutathione S-transferase